MRAMNERWIDERLDDRFDRWQRLSLSILASLAIGLLVSHL